MRACVRACVCVQDSDYETLIKNKKIELRFVLENNQIIKRLG